MCRLIYKVFQVVPNLFTGLTGNISCQSMAKLISPAKKWVFTWNNYPENAVDLLDTLVSKCSVLVYQTEVGESGTPHIQGCFNLLKKSRGTSLGLPNTIWFKKCDNLDASCGYCSKDKTYDGKARFIKGYVKIVEPKILSYEQLYPWQKEIEDLLKIEPDDRKIIWIWCSAGASGKTTLTKRLAVRYQTVAFATCTKSADIATIAHESKKMYLLNFTRSQQDFCPWQALESLKDGLISDSKLKKETRQVICDSPHVVCFANFPPDEKKLSADRWDIRCLDDREDMKKDEVEIGVVDDI